MIWCLGLTRCGIVVDYEGCILLWLVVPQVDVVGWVVLRGCGCRLVVWAMCCLLACGWLIVLVNGVGVRRCGGWFSLLCGMVWI